MNKWFSGGLIVFCGLWVFIGSICLFLAIMDSRSEMIADMQKNPEKYMTQEQIMFVRINDINKKLDVLIKKVGAEKK
jgi:hypothetical protein